MVTKRPDAAKAAPNAAAKKVRGKPFVKGKSGNPAGMKRGTRHRSTLLIEAMSADDRTAIVDKIITQARSGYRASQKLIIDRIEPPRRGRIAIAWPPIKVPADAVAAMEVITAAVSRGDISPAEAAELIAVVREAREAIDLLSIETELRQLEKQVLGS
jgi:hypothetical protein